MRSRFLLGAILGTVASVLCQAFISNWWTPVLISASVGYPHPYNWGTALGALGFALGCVSYVLPGVCAGFISGRRGFLVGAVAAAAGSFLYGLYFELMQVHSGALKFNARTWTTILFIYPTIYAVGLIVTSAVGGGAGQLLRSNNRWRGP